MPLQTHQSNQPNPIHFVILAIANFANQCDETRPRCNACTRSGRVCPGYPHPLDVVLRPQKAFNRRSGNTATASAAQSLPKRDEVDARSDPSSSSNSPSSELSPQPFYPVTSGPTISPQVPGGLYLPMEETVTALFFNSYIYTPRDPLIRAGSMEFLPQLYGAAPFGSALRMSSLAVAYFGVAAWTRQESLLRSAQQCFGKALSLTRLALQGNIEQNYDDILMTLMLLYIYEVSIRMGCWGMYGLTAQEFISIKENNPSPKHHLRGAIALINTCRPERRSSALSDTLTNAIQGEIVSPILVTLVPLHPSELTN